ncbi:MAG: hypothetical protein ACRD5E_08750 [Nitrososphaeraceae archaeon]
MLSLIWALITIVLLEMVSTAVTVPNLVKGTSNSTIFGGLSTESIDIAESNETDLIRKATSVNNTDFGGLSPRSVNIAN